MTTRKTDDNIILQMLREGKTQKAIAEHFQCSGAAICKRLKKLLSSKPASLEKLTEKETKFVLAIAQGKTQTQAAVDSYECSSLDSAKSIGYQKMQEPDIQFAVAELMQRNGLTRTYRVRKLKNHIDHPDPNVSLKGLEQSWKLDGAYTEKHAHVHMSYDDMVKAHQAGQAEIDAFKAKYGDYMEEDVEGD